MICVISYFTACPKGFYGLACSYKCGHCIKGKACEPQNGTCIGGCMDGFSGSLCTGMSPFTRVLLVIIVCYLVLSDSRVFFTHVVTSPAVT